MLIVTLDNYNDMIPPGIADWMVELSEIQGIDARNIHSPEKIASLILKELNESSFTHDSFSTKAVDNEKVDFVTEKESSDGVYTGSIKNGLLNGHGYYYQGEIKDGKPNGLGKIIYSNGACFDGEFIDDKRNGHGIIRYSNGAVFEGEFKDDKCNGHGIFKSKNGDVFEGDYIDGDLNAHGKEWIICGLRSHGDCVDILEELANISIVKERFKGGKRNGHGVLKIRCGYTFEGEFKDGKANGYGVFKFLGDICVGKYIDNKRYGYCIDICSDGEVFEGEYKDGKRNGPGILYKENGIVCECEFKDDSIFHIYGKYDDVDFEDLFARIE